MAEPNRRLILIAGVPALLAISACDRRPTAPSAPAAPPAAFKAVDITGADYARDFTLADPEGKRRALADFKGKVVVVFFGYTQCPDVCPVTMAEIASVKREMGADGERVTGVFITVDPERDTPEVLKAYVAGFGPGVVGLRGTVEETKALTKHFKAFYAKVPGKTDGSYTVDHTAGSYVYDAQGRIRLFVRYGSGAQALAHDLKLLVQQAG